MSDITINVIIATSHNRTNLLFDRSLQSVYMQRFRQKDYAKQIQIIIIDDNQDDILDSLNHKLLEKRQQLGLNDKFPTRIIQNTRTKAHSGTGAWNSGALEYLKKYMPNNIATGYLAFLDDDDEWEQNYLQECLDILISHKEFIGLIASGIYFVSQGNETILQPSEKMLTKEHIFQANPYIQGSNLFINLKVFFAIGGFDESLKSTTDRDLLMRYIEYADTHKVATHFINKPLVRYFYDDSCVTKNLDNKHKGLDIFYRKYKNEFDDLALKQSLKRAKEKFNYKKQKDTMVEKSLNKITQPSKTTSEPINLILGVICLDSTNLQDFLESFFKLNPLQSKYLNNFTIYIVSYKKCQIAFEKIMQNYPKQNIVTHFLEEKYCIARNRTILQQSIYKIGNKTYGNDFVSWIVDDDMRFYAIYNDKKYTIDYFYHIAQAKLQNIDVCVSKTCGEPPLPFLATLRTQLLDLWFHSKIAKCNQAIKYATYNLNNFEDFYYDYSIRDFKHLEYPYFTNQTLQWHIEQITNGHIATRQIMLNDDSIQMLGKIKQGTIYRGGNTIIYNPLMLQVENFTPNNANYNRRSDFNWAIITSELLNKTIKEIILPITHTRNTQKISIENELRKIISDWEGIVFYRAFQTICQNYKNSGVVSLKSLNKLLFSNYYHLKYIIIYSLLRIKCLNHQIKHNLTSNERKIYNNVDIIVNRFYDIALEFCKYNDYDDYRSNIDLVSIHSDVCDIINLYRRM